MIGKSGQSISITINNENSQATSATRPRLDAEVAAWRRPFPHHRDFDGDEVRGGVVWCGVVWCGVV